MSEVTQPLTFQIDKGELKLPAWLKAAEQQIKTMSPLAVAKAAVSPGFWITLAGRTPDLLRELVDVPIADILVGAWKNNKRFQKFQKGKLPPDKLSVVPLSTHHIKASRAPYIELFLDGESAGKIKFELILDITVDVGAVVVQDGMIKRLEAGNAKVVGTLKCAGEVVAEKASREFAWAEGISFGEGIAISAA